MKTAMYRSDNWAMRIGYLSCLSHLRPMHLVKGQVLLDLISDFFFCRFAFRHWCPEYGPGPTGDERRGRERDLEGGWEGGGWATYIGASRATGGRGAPALSPSPHLSMCNCSWSYLSRSSSWFFFYLWTANLSLLKQATIEISCSWFNMTMIEIFVLVVLALVFFFYSLCFSSLAYNSKFLDHYSNPRIFRWCTIPIAPSWSWFKSDTNWEWLLA